MKIERIEVEGHRALDRVDWHLGELTVIEGDACVALAEAVFTLSQVPRGWSDLAAFYDALALPPRPVAEGEEAPTTRWRLTCAPRGEVFDPRRAEYELGIYPPSGALGWEIRYEFLRLFDDFDSAEVLAREGPGATYTLSKPRRDARRGGRESFAGDIPVLGARQELFDDPAVNPFAQALARWSWFRGFETAADAAARAIGVFPGFHERLVEGGGNLTNALYSLYDLDATRDAVDAMVRAAVPAYEGVRFERLGDGDLSMRVQCAGRALAPPELPDETLRALCAIAAVTATAPPALSWFDAAVWALPEAVLPLVAEALVALSARSQVVLASPPDALRDALREALGAERDGQHITLAPTESGRPWEGRSVTPLTGHSPAP